MHPHCSPVPPPPRTDDIMCYLCLCACFISLNLISSRSMHATNGTVPLLRQNLIPLPSSIHLLMASTSLPSVSYCDSCCSEPDSLYEVAALSLLGAHPGRAQLSHVRVSFFSFFMNLLSLSHNVHAKLCSYQQCARVPFLHATSDVSCCLLFGDDHLHRCGLGLLVLYHVFPW